MGGTCELLCTYVCAYECVKNFTVQKNSRKKFSPMACIGEIGETSPGENFCTYGIQGLGVREIG